MAKNEIKISEIEWRTNLHSYYLFEKSKSEVFLVKKLNTLDSKYLKLLDNYSERIISIAERAFQTNVSN